MAIILLFLQVCIGGQVLKVSIGVDHMAAMVREII